MIVAISGHRPNKIPDITWAKEELSKAIIDLKTEKLIQGMAAGIDLISAEMAMNLGISLICAKPWKNHQTRIGGSSYVEDSWNTTYKAATSFGETINVTDYDNYPGPWVYQIRNEWMVDHTEVLLSYWDGSPGGTRNCVNYAIKKDVPIYRIDPLKMKVGWFRGGPI